MSIPESRTSNQALLVDETYERHARVYAWVWDFGLKPSEFMLYATIALHGGPGRRCWPGQERLAEMMGCSVDTVQRGVKRLVEVGLLQVDEPARFGYPKMYTLLRHRTGAASDTASTRP